MKNHLPSIRLAGKPDGLTLRAPRNAMERWDRTIAAKSAAQETASIDILDEIGANPWTGEGITASKIKEQLKAAGKGPVRVTLNSPGGDAFEGVAIYNLLREHPGKVTVNVIGLAASAASVIAMAGDRIEIGEAAFLMIHSAWGVVMGNRDDMREFADLLDQLDTAVAELYARRSGNSLADVKKMMRAETWMSGKDAVEKGFADQTAAADTAKASTTVLPSAAAIAPALLAASGERQRSVVRLGARTPGASGPLITTKELNMQTIKERLDAFRAERQSKAAQLQALVLKQDGGATLDAEEQETFDALDSEITAIDGHIKRLERAAELNMAAVAPAAAPAAPGTSVVAAPAAPVRQHSGIVSVRQNLEPGVRMARFAMSMHQARGNPQAAVAWFNQNQRWRDTSPEVGNVLLAAVAAGDTTTSGWASELVYNTNVAAEFIEFLRPMTIIGKLTTFRRVPFNIRVGSQTAGPTAYWVGQGAPIPVSKGTTSSVTLGIAKAAGLCAIDDELARSASPSAELWVRDELAKTVAAMLDVSFVDPTQGGSDNVQPPSMTYGVTSTIPSGTNYSAFVTDVKALFSAYDTANLPTSGGVWIMSSTIARSLSLMVTSLGVKQFDGITPEGGTLLGYPVIVSQAAYFSGSPQYANMIIFLLPHEVFLADDGQVAIGVSNEASIQLLDNPTNASTGGTTATTMVSMFQTQSWAIKAVRYINWKKARSQACQFIQAAAYTS